MDGGAYEAHAGGDEALMLKESGIDKSYWCEALMPAADIRNILLRIGDAPRRQQFVVEDRYGVAQ